eukprot:gene14328-biopygen20097
MGGCSGLECKTDGALHRTGRPATARRAAHWAALSRPTPSVIYVGGGGRGGEGRVRPHFRQSDALLAPKSETLIGKLDYSPRPYSLRAWSARAAVRIAARKTGNPRNFAPLGEKVGKQTPPLRAACPPTHPRLHRDDDDAAVTPNQALCGASIPLVR